jgi:hypothetical protein
LLICKKKQRLGEKRTRGAKVMAWAVHSLEGAGGKQVEGARWFMKFAQRLQNMKCKMAVIGLGATLLLANACYAQQEVNPDTFDANPGNQTDIGVVSPQPADGGALAVSSQQAQPASADRAELVPAKQQLAFVQRVEQRHRHRGGIGCDAHRSQRDVLGWPEAKEE